MTSIAAEISMPSQTSRHLSSSTDNIVLGIHRGAIDQTTITTQPPSEVMKKLSNILQDMGVDMQEESTFRYRCIRPKKSSGEEDDADARSVSTVATTTTTDRDRDVDAAVEGSEHIEKDRDTKGGDETRDSTGMNVGLDYSFDFPPAFAQ
ncbi:hypothetical protein D9613_003689 [Agrocybe pediades]|uniref:Uncharacterized protein n=1 Tax=Agrocybe pediades TaxID=84607 RepID=A0A8H4VJ80_9AGAR|nr:hypothetical protein D9613_003689 [Agrocybe pediades]